MDKGYKKSLDEIVEERFQVLEILNEESKEVSMFNQIDSKNKMAGIILELERWSNGSSSLNAADKKEFLKFSIYWLKKALMYYSSTVKDMGNSEMKAAYWKIKYQGAKKDQELFDKMFEINVRLSEENERLKEELKKSKIIVE